MRIEGSAEVLEYRRRIAVRWILGGRTTVEVAGLLGVDPRSVRRWVATFLHDGSAALVARRVPGRPGKLTGEKELTVISWLLDSPLKHGFLTECWTAPRLVQLIAQHFDIKIHPHSLNRWLNARGFSPQKPQCFAQDRDPDAIAHWLQFDWPRIQRLARQRDASIVFLDESGLLLMPLLRRSQAPKGYPPIVKVRMQHRQHVSVAAALWGSADWQEVGMFSRALLNGYFNNQRIAIFLHQLLRRVPGKVILVWNGGSMHKGEPIRWVQQMYRGRLLLRPLPAYAPEFTPVEQIRQLLKDSRLAHVAPADANELFRAVHSELDPVRFDTHRLWCFFHQSALPLPRTLQM